jgi:glutamyl-tRNA synthetase
VIRGEEWISSAPKHLLLYKYFGWEPPVLCHMPLLRNADKSKLSKRKNPTGIEYYERMGFMPEAVTNYLGMMGWSMPDESEKFTLDEMIQSFDINRVSLGGPVFDIEKLSWLNGRYIRESLSPEEFMQRFSAWAFQPEMLEQLVPLIQKRVDTFTDVAPLAGFLFSALPDITPESFSHKQLTPEQQRVMLQFVLWRLEALQDWNRDAIEKEIVGLGEVLGHKMRDMVFPLFIAMAGTSVSVSVIDSICALGLDVVRARFRHAITVLGGISKKEAKRLEKEFADLNLV